MVHTSRQSAVFLFACGVAFVASVAATVYFCRSMCCEMEMPGGWTIPPLFRHNSSTIVSPYFVSHFVSHPWNGSIPLTTAPSCSDVGLVKEPSNIL